MQQYTIKYLRSVCFLFTLFFGMAVLTSDIVINQYDASCIAILQLMNGQYFLSQGGADCIEYMITGIDLKGKKVLDFGSGLGGPAFYLATNHGARVSGVDVDPFLVTQAEEIRGKKRLNQVSFALIHSSALPFEDASFDVVFSKETIVHVSDKRAVFKEFYRVLKPGGTLVIMDWFKEKEGLSAELLKTHEIDRFAQAGAMRYISIQEYVNLLEQAHFSSITTTNASPLHLAYLKNDLEQLSKEKGEEMRAMLGDKSLEENRASWRANIVTFESGEIQTFLVKAVKALN